MKEASEELFLGRWKSSHRTLQKVHILLLGCRIYGLNDLLTGNEYYHTQEHAALKMSWEPFTPGKKVPSFFEDQYISDLYANMDYPAEWQSSLPMEHLIVGELFNPRSRARRQKRWQKELQMLERSKEEYVKKELADLQGRRKQDAKREGEFRWKLAVQKYKSTKHWQRWVKRGGQKRLEIRLKRRHRRSVARLRRLKNLQLDEGKKNQVVPSAFRAPGSGV